MTKVMSPMIISANGDESLDSMAISTSQVWRIDPLYSCPMVMTPGRIAPSIALVVDVTTEPDALLFWRVSRVSVKALQSRIELPPSTIRVVSMAQQTRSTDTLLPAKSRRPQARVIAVGCALALTVFIALLIWSPWGGSGDPGGRILAQLKPVAYTLPAGAAVSYRQMFEPHQDSCDGNPATKGWSQVVSQTNFQWSGTPNSLISTINTRMQKLGWSFSSASGNGQPGGEWTKTLAEGTTANATLTAEPGGSTWTLIALAPPVGRAVSGC